MRFRVELNAIGVERPFALGAWRDTFEAAATVFREAVDYDLRRGQRVRLVDDAGGWYFAISKGGES